jgi:6-phosphogluconate dehydrogenase
MSDCELGIINLGAMGESRLVELMRDQLQEDALEDIPNYVEDTSEVNWLLQEAFKRETSIPVITQSVIELVKSRGNQQNAYRAVAAMRKGFGSTPTARTRESENSGSRVGSETSLSRTSQPTMQ